MRTGEVDCFTDCRRLPGTAEVGLAALRALGGVQGPKRTWGRPRCEPTYMAVPVNLEVSAGRDAFCAFAPYSIHAVLLSDGVELLTLHDSGVSITLVGSEAFVEGLREILLAAGMPDVGFDQVPPV
jgi:hypothetical protein